MVVWVEAAILDDEALLKDKRFQKIKDKLVTFKWVPFFFFSFELINEPEIYEKETKTNLNFHFTEMAEMI